jgi:uncharacterized membrane protein YagU involved in acid resistance
VLAAILGLFLQWGMSVLIAAIFAVASGRFQSLKRHWIWAGLAYGAVVFLVMNYVVIPLSAAPFAATFTVLTFVGNALAMLCFGLVITYFARDDSPEQHSS